MDSTPILEEIEAWARSLPTEQRKYVLWLLEALAVESSTAYGGGRHSMESALEASMYMWKKHNFDIQPPDA